MSVLHTVNKSPFERSSCETCLRLAEPGSAILFIEDGVYGVMKNTEFAAHLAARDGDFKLYALAPDLSARGLPAADVLDGIKLVNYDEFVDLAVSHERVQAWL